MSGPEHAADLVWNPADMAASRQVLRDEHGDIEVGRILIDRFEWANRSGKDGYTFDGQAWWGGDIDKVWLKGEAEGTFNEGAESVEVQALWSHAIDPWFDLQLGLRQDFTRGPDRTYLVAGVQGLAPYWFEVDVSAFLSNKGDLSARAEAEYDLRITQSLILQPRVELDLAAQDVPELGIGSGLSTGELGVRLRYEIERQFAPYVGVQYERAFGDTADFRRAAGEKAGGWSFLVGIRSWF
ncbi:copper resistance protein B [Sphingomonas parva]|uniref:copper resistance protein B n=1 Tax=Sphingomonas parva TaxID=2555898 RepID=UPI001CDD6856|nr:copper resistance protein B [Sphingomonas parva]